MSKQIIALFEMCMIVLVSVSFSYMLDQMSEPHNTAAPTRVESSSLTLLRAFVIKWIGGNLVSAQSATLWTCPQNTNGVYCQEYPSALCSASCTTTCHPGTRDTYAPCQLGTCFDPTHGVCTTSTPQSLCTQQGGQWSLTQPAVCNRDCCAIRPDGNGGAAQAQYTTQAQCAYLGSTLSAPVTWGGAYHTTNEVSCLLKAQAPEEGACVLALDPVTQKHTCEFGTRASCLTKGGIFYADTLCTNPSLDTTCTKTTNTRCIPGKDEVYFVDSCGNRANVYDSTKLNDIAGYWSTVVPRNQTCLLNSGSNSLANQRTCGSCNYLQGSVCGTPRSGTDQTPTTGNYVCRDLSCTDEWGARRQNFESWCAYDGRIGVDSPNSVRVVEQNIAQQSCISQTGTNLTAEENTTITVNQSVLSPYCQQLANLTVTNAPGTNEERAVDVPGSRHYKRLCVDGEVRTEPCAQYRDEVCSQSTVTTSGLTQASCRVNTWQQCLAANSDREDLNKCEENPDCFLKHVEVNQFKFDMCVPQFPPGLSLSQSGPSTNAEETICSYGTQTCTYIEKKRISGWKCIINCGCKTKKFTETMNNLCISLGDCGGHVNLAGEFSDRGYSVQGRAPRVSQTYIDGLAPYTTPIRGQSATVLNRTQIAALFGVPESDFEPSNLLSTFALIGPGAAGLLQIQGVAEFLGANFDDTSAAQVGGSFGLAFSAALVGASIGYILGTVFGLSDSATMVVMAVSAVGGALVGAGVFSESAATWLAAAMPYFLIAIAVVILIFSLLGIGKTRERHVTFECKPWQPPRGGVNCGQCGGNGLPCSRYQCESYGAACRYLNEGTGNEICVNIASNDVIAPIIEVNPNAIGPNLTYTNVQSNIGTTIRSTIATDGCVQEYTSVQFGVVLNEPGTCRISDTHTAHADEMDGYFTSSGNNYVLNHTQILAAPTLDELGVTGLDPNRRGTATYYVRCEDFAGNGDDRAEYTVQFCVAPANDVTPPTITKFVPPSPGYAGLNTMQFPLAFFTNEPATCRYDTDSAKPYALMTGGITCNNELNQITLDGWRCTTNLELTANSPTFYFKCVDQPWLGMDEANPSLPDPFRNEMAQSVPYSIIRTTQSLNISTVSPNGQTFSLGSLPASITLQITTTGGVANGNAICSFSLNNGVSVPFFTTGGSTHTQGPLSLFDGSHQVAYSCTDAAGNIASASADFTIELDATGPAITRTYSQGTNLIVVTNEASTCAYTLTNCAFTFNQGTTMSGTNALFHTLVKQAGKTYYVFCEDPYHNAGSCLAIRT
jgi:hypothetical protein